MAWNHTRMGLLTRFLGSLQRHCADARLPTLTALVVNQQTGECGEGFFKDLLAIGRARPGENPQEAAARERALCWSWAQNI